MAKDNINKVKGQVTTWEKSLSIYSIDEGQISLIHKDFLNICNTKTNNPIEKQSLQRKKFKCPLHI